MQQLDMAIASLVSLILSWRDCAHSQRVGHMATSLCDAASQWASEDLLL